jgi:glyoxylase-like metal-dependent hydrolase (beta-lactamase superfamily II)
MDRLTTPEGIMITALWGGDFDIDPSVFPDLTIDPGPAEGPGAAFNAFLIQQTGQPLTLVDAGGGTWMGELGGGLPDALGALGISADQIGRLFLTHLHTDRCGGALMPDGTPVFRNAEVLLHRAEAAHWADRDHIGARFLGAYRGRTGALADGDQIAPGIAVWHLPGHRPGQAGLLIGGTAALAGDIIHAER